ncbi:hypothetical protein [Streptomyces sp. NBC_01317]|uniref:hypothetical protein n=1 Tax=Streptomyces sp. NBC_01317 TaxID=2903822 RepID=UPI003FA3DB63
MAHVADQLAEANWMFATVNRDEDADPLEFPTPIPRPGEPGDGPEERSTPDIAKGPGVHELSAFFA